MKSVKNPYPPSSNPQSSLSFLVIHYDEWELFPVNVSVGFKGYFIDVDDLS